MGGKKSKKNNKSKRGRKKAHDPHVEVDYDAGRKSDVPCPMRFEHRFVCLNEECANPCEPRPWCCEDCSGTWYCGQECFEACLRTGAHDRLCRKSKGASNVRVARIDRFGTKDEMQVGLFGKVPFKRGQIILNVPPFLLCRGKPTDIDDYVVDMWRAKMTSISMNEAVDAYERARHLRNAPDDPTAPWVLDDIPRHSNKVAANAVAKLFGFVEDRGSNPETMTDAMALAKWMRGNLCGYEYAEERDELLNVVMSGVSNFTEYVKNYYSEVCEFAEGNRTSGEAYYPFVHWINHDCSANTETVHFADNLLLIAKRDIEAGEELTTSLCMSHIILTRKARSQVIKRYFGFDCQCETCKNDDLPWGNLRAFDDPDEANSVEAMTRKVDLLKEAMIEAFGDKARRFLKDADEGTETLWSMYETRSDRRRKGDEREMKLHFATHVYNSYAWLCAEFFMKNGIDEDEDIAAHGKRLAKFYAAWREASKTKNRLGRPATFLAHVDPIWRVFEYLVRFAILVCESGGNAPLSKYDALLDDFAGYVRTLLYPGCDPLVFFARSAPFVPILGTLVVVELTRRRAKESKIGFKTMDEAAAKHFFGNFLIFTNTTK